MSEEPIRFRRFAHDLRNPLGALNGFVYLLKNQRDKLSSEQLDKIIDGMERSVGKMSELLDAYADKQED